MDKKKIIICIVVLIVMILIIVILSTKNKTTNSVTQTSNEQKIIYNNETGTYIVYDENQQIVYNGVSESQADFYSRHPDYDPKSPVVEDEYTEILRANNEIE